METSKRCQIPTTNACANFSFRGLCKKKNFTLFCSFPNYFRHTENYFRHVSKQHTSQQQQPHTKHTNHWRQPSTRTHGRFYNGRGRPGFRLERAVPGIRVIEVAILRNCTKDKVDLILESLCLEIG